MSRPQRRSPERRPDDVAPLGGLEGLLLTAAPPARLLMDPARAEARAHRWQDVGADVVATYGRDRCADPLARYGEPTGPRRTPVAALLRRRTSTDTAAIASLAPGPASDAQDDLDDEDDPPFLRAISSEDI